MITGSHDAGPRNDCLALLAQQAAEVDEKLPFDTYFQRREELLLVLPERLRTHAPALRDIVGNSDSFTDSFYRLYHHSFKVYRLQDWIGRAVLILAAIAPERQLNSDYSDIVRQALSEPWELAHNFAWAEKTRPIVEAAFHTRQFVQATLAVSADKSVPNMLSADWAITLYLWGLR